MTVERGFGRLPAPDIKDKRFLMRAAMPQIAKPKPRVRPYRLRATRYQGRFPHCVGYSTYHKIVAAPIMVSPERAPDPVHIYNGAQTLDEWPGEGYDGTSVRGAFKFMQGEGNIKSYVWGQSIDECRAFILNGYGTIVFGTNWYASMDHPSPAGLVSLPTSYANPIGGHAYHWFWYDKKTDTDWFQNSWEDWGVLINGIASCFRMRGTDTARLLYEDGEAGAAIEQKVKPVERGA